MSTLTLRSVKGSALTHAEVDANWTALNSDKLESGDVATVATTGAFSDLTGKPTTLSGYGITDAQPLDADLTALAAAGNSTVLAATTASFLTADETKLDGIEAGADVTDAANVAAAGAAMLGTAQSFTAAQGVTPVALTDGANIATDCSLSNNFTVTLGGNRTLDNPTNLVAGRTYTWTVTQDGTGGRTLAYGSYFDFPGGTAPTLSTAASSVDLIVGYAISTTRILCVANLSFA